MSVGDSTRKIDRRLYLAAEIPLAANHGLYRRAPGAPQPSLRSRCAFTGKFFNYSSATVRSVRLNARKEEPRRTVRRKTRDREVERARKRGRTGSRRTKRNDAAPESRASPRLVSRFFLLLLPLCPSFCRRALDHRGEIASTGRPWVVHRASHIPSVALALD